MSARLNAVLADARDIVESLHGLIELFDEDDPISVLLCQASVKVKTAINRIDDQINGEPNAVP